MAKILELAINFAKEIQKTDEYKELQEAKKKNDADKVLNEDIKNFNNLTTKVKELIAKKDSKKEEIDKTNEEIKNAYDRVMSNENMINFNVKSNNMNILMNKINSILIDAVNGKEISLCSLNKSSECGSCDKCLGKK